VVPRNLWLLVGCQEGGSQATVERLDTTLRPESIPENMVGIPIDLPQERGRHQAPQTAGSSAAWRRSGVDLDRDRSSRASRGSTSPHAHLPQVEPRSCGAAIRAP
jgi:hypothetical protein